MLLKFALILGVDFVENMTFEEICPKNLLVSSSDGSSHLSTNSIDSKCDTIPEEDDALDGNVLICSGKRKSEQNSSSSCVSSDEEKELRRNLLSSSSSNTSSPSKSFSESNSSGCSCCCHVHCNQEEEDQDKTGVHAHFSVTSRSTSTSYTDYPSLLDQLHSTAFDVILGADGRRNTLADHFPRKEFRGKLAIAITANFVNNHTLTEAQMPEISGISFIYNQQLFKALYDDTGIDLENICYYKDDTHYFVMTAKKTSLLSRGVLLNDHPDTVALLHPDNINREELLNYARHAAKWTTGN